MYVKVESLAAEMLDFTTSTSVSDGIDRGGKSVCELHTDGREARSLKQRQRAGGRLDVCVIDPHVLLGHSWLGCFLREQCRLTCDWRDRSEQPPSPPHKIKRYLFPVGLSDGINAGVFVSVCGKHSFTLCVSLLKRASRNVKSVYRRACVHGDSQRGCVLNVRERV